MVVCPICNQIYSMNNIEPHSCLKLALKRISELEAWKGNFGEKLIQNSVNKKDFIKLKKDLKVQEDMDNQIREKLCSLEGRMDVLENDLELKLDEMYDWIKKKIKALESIFKKLFMRIMKDKCSKSDLDSDLALIIKNELKQLEDK